jgi:hypothetical protein
MEVMTRVAATRSPSWEYDLSVQAMEGTDVALVDVVAKLSPVATLLNRVGVEESTEELFVSPVKVVSSVSAVATLFDRGGTDICESRAEDGCRGERSPFTEL